MKDMQFVTDAAMRAARAGQEALSRAWTWMEAAAEKQRPSEVMSREAVRRMQGKQQGG